MVTNKLYWSGLLLVVACGGAVAAFASRAPAEQVAWESLDLLKAMGSRSATAHTYIASCVTAIAAAKRLEDRKDAGSAAVHGSWTRAAGYCRTLANAVCDLRPQDAPAPACNRVRGFESLV